ncbi:MAG: hypothetical protein M1812_004040 [Candelaria pacifica]|nr:MAG: hypothetical protein M1812_004040 [Candelaria pacifica]
MDHALGMSLLTLPAEVRGLILDFCFPLPKTQVQLIPYRALAHQCRLNLPLSLYLVCKSLYKELPLLETKLRSLDFTYIIQGALIGPYSRQIVHGSRIDDDRDLGHFQKRMEHVERLRLVGEGKLKVGGRSLSSASRRLWPGSKCALRVLEVQPFVWGANLVAKTITSCLAALFSHPDVAGQLRITLIRESADEVVYLSEDGSKVTPPIYDNGKEEFVVDDETDDEALLKCDFDEIENLLAWYQGNYTAGPLNYWDFQKAKAYSSMNMRE